MSFDQGEFEFEDEGNADGYRRWRERLDEQRRAFERRWGIPIGPRVRLRLRGYRKSIIGRIETSDPRSSRPKFRIRGIEFAPDEVESVSRED